eukprot:7229228-Pyramimonas_sp.AAC.1
MMYVLGVLPGGRTPPGGGAQLSAPPSFARPCRARASPSSKPPPPPRTPVYALAPPSPAPVPRVT